MEKNEDVKKYLFHDKFLSLILNVHIDKKPLFQKAYPVLVQMVQYQKGEDLDK